jgi:outer membrane lipoprotein-sorting protein
MRARTCIEVIAGLLLALLAVPGLAQDPAWTLDRLMQALAQRDHAQAEFTEAKYMRLLSRPLNLRGKLSFRAPDWLEKRTLDPSEEILLADGDRLTVEIPARRIRREFSMQELPAVWGFVESIRATLRGDRAGLERFYRVELEGEVRHWRLALQPKDPKMAEVVAEIRMSGAAGRIGTIEIVEASGDRSVLKIREPQT